MAVHHSKIQLSIVIVLLVAVALIALHFELQPLFTPFGGIAHGHILYDSGFDEPLAVEVAELAPDTITAGMTAGFEGCKTRAGGCYPPWSALAALPAGTVVVTDDVALPHEVRRRIQQLLGDPSTRCAAIVTDPARGSESLCINQLENLMYFTFVQN